jgi:hypothetical protein
LAQFKYEPVGKSKEELEEEKEDKEIEEKMQRWYRSRSAHWCKFLWRGMELLADPQLSDEMKKSILIQLQTEMTDMVSDFYLFRLVPGY